VSIGKTTLETSLNIAKYKLEGNNLKSSLNKNLRLAGRNILNKSSTI